MIRVALAILAAGAGLAAAASAAFPDSNAGCAAPGREEEVEETADVGLLQVQKLVAGARSEAGGTMLIPSPPVAKQQQVQVQVPVTAPITEVTTTSPVPEDTATSGGAQVCEDLPGWKDQEALGCSDYTSKNWCNSSGDPGSGWVADWGALSSYVDCGYDAAAACCGCGRTEVGKELDWNSDCEEVPMPEATTTSPVPEDAATSDGAQVCEDLPLWKDRRAWTCSNYTSMDWCTSSGGPGSEWGSRGGPGNEFRPWGPFSERGACGYDATTACCGCGRTEALNASDWNTSEYRECIDLLPREPPQEFGFIFR